MWKNFEHWKPYTWGKHGKEFRFRLSFDYRYYGYQKIKPHKEEIVAIWDSLNESFFEKETRKEIFIGDIEEWWDDEYAS